MRLLLIRHGQTFQNESGILMGRTPGELSELGHEQAILTGKKIKPEKIDIIFSSPSTRCRDTLQEILGQLDKHPAIEFTDDLQERDFGALTNKQLDPTMYDLLENDTPKSRELEIESVEHLLQRTKDFIATIKEKHLNETVLILTHSNNIRAMLMYFLNKSFLEVLDLAKIKNCALTQFDFTPEKGFELLLLDDTSHLNK